MRRDLFTEDHEAFRELAREFVEKEIVPAYPEWEKAGRMPRDVFKQMGALGMLGMAIPEEYGAMVAQLGQRSHADRRDTGLRAQPGQGTDQQYRHSQHVRRCEQGVAVGRCHSSMFTRLGTSRHCL